MNSKQITHRLGNIVVAVTVLSWTTAAVVAQPPKRTTSQVREAYQLRKDKDITAQLQTALTDWQNKDDTQRVNDSLQWLQAMQQLNPDIDNEPGKQLWSGVGDAVDVILLRGTTPQKAEAINTAGLLSLARGKDREAVDLFRKLSDDAWTTPDTSTRMALHFNYGTALQRTGDPQEAFQQYWRAFDSFDEQVYSIRVVTSCAKAMTELPEPRPEQAVQLNRFLLREGHHRESQDIVYQLLEAWRDDERATRALIPELLKYFSESGVNVQAYHEQQQPRLEKIWNDTAFNVYLRELNKIYDDDQFDDLGSPEFAQRMRAMDEFRRLVDVCRDRPLQRGESALRPLAEALFTAARTQARDRRKGGADQVAPSTIGRCMVAYLIDPTLTEAALYAMRDLESYARQVNGGEKLLGQFVWVLFDEKNQTLLRASTREDWMDIYSMHVVLAILAERYPRQFEEIRIPKPADLFFLRQLLVDEREIRQFDPSFAADPDAIGRLGRAYERQESFARAFATYLDAGQRFLGFNAREPAKRVLQQAQQLITNNRVNPADAERTRLRRLLARAEAN